MSLPPSGPDRGSGGIRADQAEAQSQERRTALRRRLMDISKLLPVLGMLLFAVPLLWPAGNGEGSEPVTMSAAITYIFLAWAVLVVLSLCFSLAVGFWASHWTGKEPRRRRGGEG